MKIEMVASLFLLVLILDVKADEKPIGFSRAFIRLIRGLRESSAYRLSDRMRTLFEGEMSKNPEAVKEEILDILDDVNEDVKIKMVELENAGNFSEEDMNILKKIEVTTLAAMRSVDRMQPQAMHAVLNTFKPMLLNLLDTVRKQQEVDEEQETTMDIEISTEQYR